MISETVALPEQKITNHFGTEIDHKIASVIAQAELRCVELRQTWGNCEILQVEADMDHRSQPRLEASFSVAYVKSK